MPTMIQGFSFGVPNNRLHAYMLVLSRYLHEAMHLHFTVIRAITIHTHSAIRFSSQNAILQLTLHGLNLDLLEEDFEHFIKQVVHILGDMDHLKLRDIVLSAMSIGGEMGDGGYEFHGKTKI